MNAAPARCLDSDEAKQQKLQRLSERVWTLVASMIESGRTEARFAAGTQRRRSSAAACEQKR